MTFHLFSWHFQPRSTLQYVHVRVHTTQTLQGPRKSIKLYQKCVLWTRDREYSFLFECMYCMNATMTCTEHIVNQCSVCTVWIDMYMYSIVSITTGICETLVECMCSVKTSPHEQFRNKYIKGPQKLLFIYCFKVYFLSHDGFLYFLFWLFFFSLGWNGSGSIRKGVMSRNPVHQSEFSN